MGIEHNTIVAKEPADICDFGWGRNGQEHDIMHICMAIEHNTVVAKEPHVCCQAIR